MLRLTFLSLVSELTSSLTLVPLKQETQKERCPKEESGQDAIGRGLMGREVAKCKPVISTWDPLWKWPQQSPLKNP